MKHNYLNNMPIEEAKVIYFNALDEADTKKQTEFIKTTEASGRVTAQAVYAKICAPHYNASAMDGIAVKASDTYGAAEQTPVTLTKEQYVVVDTGDLIPEGMDAVVMVEDVTESEADSVILFSSVYPWQNVRQVGEDICMGDMIAPTGTKITPSMCGAFLAGGILRVEVFKQPLFGIIPTGDEIVAPTDTPQIGEIIEFNSTIFSSMLKEWGCKSKVYEIVPDQKERLATMVEKAVKECDAVLLLAGSSAGRDDYTSEIIGNLGAVHVHGLAVKPGKPAVLGNIGNVPVIGLPGYPVSAIVVMEEIVKPLSEQFFTACKNPNHRVQAILGKRVVSSLKYREYIRVTLGKVGETLTAVPLPRGAGVVTSFTKADGILIVDQNREGFDAGDVVEILLLKEKAEIENALIITGSHDPLIDELADILGKNGANFHLTSSHVGSMGAITAIQNKQAHLGGVHLLDTKTGVYNESYIKKYFPNGGVKLVKAVGRIQGLMVQKGNPLGIQEFSDIVKCKYVNRQLGSGTRILCDYLIEKNHLNKNEIEGYRNEEFTHTAVAAQIAAGNADCGLGIYSAAKMYDLDFIEICIEDYDFLMDEEAFEKSQVQTFLKALKSDAFKERLKALGGYTCE